MMRTIYPFNEDWFFSKSEEIPEQIPQDWETITLPHTWNAVDGQDGGNDYFRGTCVYAKKISAPENGNEKKVFLEIPGAAMTSEVYLNGELLARHEGGYSTFRVELTDKLKNDNLLCITVDNGVNDRVYPQKADFTFYGGLYRGVNLIAVEQAHFELIKDGTPGIKATPHIHNEQDIVTADITAEAWSNTQADVTFTILDAKGQEVAQTTIPVADGSAKAILTIDPVHLWNGIEDPYLYTLRAELIENNEVVDCISTRFGCRTFSFDSEEGFFLNGKSYQLRGVSRHQDRIGVGNALTYAMHKEDMELIKEIGANTIRLAHYQHAQEFYDLADENGMIVWAEIPYITMHMEHGRENTVSQMRELITQCYNHPSIVCWGLSNEITAASPVNEDLLENHRILQELCHGMDTTRPTVIADAFMLEIDNPLLEIPDMNSYNLYFGWYMGELDENGRFFDEYHQTYPERIIGFSEYGADANMQFQTNAPDVGDYSEQYQCVYHEHLLKCIEERPYLWATHVWNMFDFAADGRDEGGAHGLNQKGLVSFDRKQKKDAFYLYKAAWSKESFVYLCGKRYHDRTEPVTEIKVYSNQPEVSLYVDGSLFETKQGSVTFVFHVPIIGEHQIIVKADGYSDTMVIQKTDEKNPSYDFKKETVVNWFDKKELDPTCFSIMDKISDVTANPEAGKLWGNILKQARASRGDVAQSTAENKNLQKMMGRMTVQKILKQAGDTIKPEQIQALNDALQKIKK